MVHREALNFHLFSVTSEITAAESVTTVSENKVTVLLLFSSLHNVQFISEHFPTDICSNRLLDTTLQKQQIKLQDLLVVPLQNNVRVLFAAVLKSWFAGHCAAGNVVAARHV